MLLVILKMNFKRSIILLMRNLPDLTSIPRIVWDNLVLVLTSKAERGLLTSILFSLLDREAKSARSEPSKSYSMSDLSA